MSESRTGDASRVEAAEAGIHAEIDELDEGREPEEHVTATDVATAPVAPENRATEPANVPAAHHHHPTDPNVGVVRGKLGRGAVLAAVISGGLTIAAVVLLALAINGNA